MCFETEFRMLLTQTKVVWISLAHCVIPSFEMSYGGCGTFNSSNVGNPRDQSAPTGTGLLSERPECRYLNKRLEEEIPAGNRNLSLRFNLNFNPVGNGGDNVRFSLVAIFLEGEVLKGLHSIMACGVDGLGVKLKVELTATTLEHRGGHGQPAELHHFILSTDYVDLRPQLTNEGRHDHLHYALANGRVNLTEDAINTGRLLSWKVSKLDVVVQQKGCNCSQLVTSHATELNRKLLVGGVGADLVIRTKDNGTFRCHRAVLIAQCPVLERMLVLGHFLEGSTGQIEMFEWTSREVRALLAFLYYGGVEEPVKDASLNVALLKMADYYMVQKLEEKMREVWLKRTVQDVPADAAFRMVDLAGFIVESEELNRKAVDALALRSDEELLGSGLFREMFPSTAAKTLFLNSRIRI